MPKALDGQIVMEKTPRYFVTVETPARVHAMSKDVKLIVVVRDPVTRAISDYTQIISKTPNIPAFESLAFKNQTTGTDTTKCKDLIVLLLWGFFSLPSIKSAMHSISNFMSQRLV